MSVDQIALGVGYGLLALLSLALMGGLLWLIVEVLGRQQWKRLQRLYTLYALGYWMVRLEEEGTHCFQRPDESIEDYETRAKKMIAEREGREP